MCPAPSGSGKGSGPARAPGAARTPAPEKEPTTSKGPPSPYTGRVIAGCLVGDRLGRGATSHVFRAKHQRLNKDIALKILGKESAGSADLRTRFLSEARAVAKINHENIVKVLDVVEDQGFLCILMELVAGPTLQDRLDDEGVLAPRQAFRIAAQIARALEAAHEEKIVHRDVKPANVMLVGTSGDETVKVVDFGLAVQQEMNRVGTPLFMSPEAAQGKRIDEKSDVYALGICLYRMLTGVLPFTGATVKEILAAQVNAEMVPPSEQRPQLGKSYDALLKKLLVKSKGYRPSAAETADLLEEIADDLEERELGVRRERRRRKRAQPKKRSYAGLLAALAVAGVVVAGLVYAFSGGKDKTPNAAVDPAAAKKTDVPAPVAAVDPAETDFKEIEAWIAENPTNRADAIRKWKLFEKKHPGTKWAEKAAKNRAYQEKAFGGTVDEPTKPAERAPTSKPTPPRDVESPTLKYAKIDEREKAFDFEGAWQVFNTSDLDPPPGVASDAWTQKERRLKQLKDGTDGFVARMDAGLKAAKKKPAAKDVFAEAKDGEVLVGANHEGGVVANADGSNQHTVKWSGVTRDALFKKGVVVDNVLDTEIFENNVLLAALAMELGMPEKTIDRYKSNAEGQCGADEPKVSLVHSLFGGGE